MLLVEFRPPDLWKAYHEVLEPLSWNLPLSKYGGLTFELSEAVSGRLPILLGNVLAETSCPEPVSGRVGIGTVFGEVFLHWALSNPR